MSYTFVPNFTYDEETELLSAVGHAVSYMKQLADKLNTEVRNFYYNK